MWKLGLGDDYFESKLKLQKTKLENGCELQVETLGNTIDEEEESEQFGII